MFTNPSREATSPSVCLRNEKEILLYAHRHHQVLTPEVHNLKWIFVMDTAIPLAAQTLGQETVYNSNGLWFKDLERKFKIQCGSPMNFHQECTSQNSPIRRAHETNNRARPLLEEVHA
jgi:hypothetical protein